MGLKDFITASGAGGNPSGIISKKMENFTMIFHPKRVVIASKGPGPRNVMVQLWHPGKDEYFYEIIPRGNLMSQSPRIGEFFPTILRSKDE